MGAKKSVNVTLDADLIARARALNVDLSQAAEAGLRDLIVDLEAQRWAADHREAIARFNARIAETGPAGDEYRRYG